MTRLELMPQDEADRSCREDAGFGALRTPSGNLPLKLMDVDARVVGLLSETEVRQTFVNTFGAPLEATYVFPLPDRAAVSRFRLEVGDRVVEGELQERAHARQTYDRAIRSGHRAAIAEEDRAGVFTMRAGNIMPGEEATVWLTLSGPLPYADGEATFTFPLVVAPRYVPGAALGGEQVGSGVAADTDAVPDASRISPPVLLPGHPNPVQLSLTVAIDPAGLPLGSLRSSLHAVATEPADEGGPVVVRLDPGERLDRDFVLRFGLAAEATSSSLVVCPDERGEGAGTFLLTLLPPREVAGAGRPRDVAFVLDRSGSMGGWKMVAARRAAARLVDGLTPDDRFSLYAFDHSVESPPGLERGLAPASDRDRFRAVEYLAGLEARGGTEMAGPLRRAVEDLLRAGDPADDDGSPRVIAIEGPDAGASFPIPGTCRVGRADVPGAVVLSDPALADDHVQLVRDGAGLLVRNLGGRDLQVNGERVFTSTALAHGDLVSIGQTLLVVDSTEGRDRAVRSLEEALADPSQLPDRDRVLVLVTDGQVGNEDQILRALGPALQHLRVFTLGVDQAVNAAFLRRLARGGTCEVVESEDRLDDVMDRIRRVVGAPVLTDLSLSAQGFEPLDDTLVPDRLPDLFAGVPLRVLGRYRGRSPEPTLTIRARTADGAPWRTTVAAVPDEHPALATVWARGQVRQLEDRFVKAADAERRAVEARIVRTSLAFRVLCRFTAFVAVDRAEVVNEGGHVHQVTQAVEQPAGWGEAAPGRRRSTAPRSRARSDAQRLDVACSMIDDGALGGADPFAAPSAPAPRAPARSGVGPPASAAGDPFAAAGGDPFGGGGDAFLSSRSLASVDPFAGRSGAGSPPPASAPAPAGAPGDPFGPDDEEGDGLSLGFADDDDGDGVASGAGGVEVADLSAGEPLLPAEPEPELRLREEAEPPDRRPAARRKAEEPDEARREKGLLGRVLDRLTGADAAPGRGVPALAAELRRLAEQLEAGAGRSESGRVRALQRLRQRLVRLVTALTRAGADAGVRERLRRLTVELRELRHPSPEALERMWRRAVKTLQEVADRLTAPAVDEATGRGDDKFWA